METVWGEGYIVRIKRMMGQMGIMRLISGLKVVVKYRDLRRLQSILVWTRRRKIRRKNWVI